jgi:hypothetical protein
MRSRGQFSIEVLVRKAFGLILELRAQQEASRLLSEAIAVLEMLSRRHDATAVAPLIVSFRVLRLRKP